MIYREYIYDAFSTTGLIKMSVNAEPGLKRGEPERTKCDRNPEKQPDDDVKCTEDEFYDVISWQCYDKENAFETDDANGHPFCYKKKGLQNVVKHSRRVVRDPLSVDFSGRYPHNRLPITESDLRKLVGPDEEWGKDWQDVWWFEDLNKLRGFYEFHLLGEVEINPFDDPLSIIKATTKMRNDFERRLRQRVNNNEFDDVNVRVQGDSTGDRMDASTGLIMAAQAGLPAVINIFAENGADVDAATYEAANYLGPGSNTALHMAVNVMMLADEFAERGEYHQTYMSVQRRKRYDEQMKRVLDCVSQLIYHGADIDLKNSAGFTPIMIACGAQMKETVVWNEFGEGILNDDVLDWRFEALRLLLKGAVLQDTNPSTTGVNATDNTKQTALHHACRHTDEVAVELLLSQEGINKDAQDEKGMTALHRVCNVKAWSHKCAEDSFRQLETLTLLLNGGVLWTPRDEDNRTALDMLKVPLTEQDIIDVRFGGYFGGREHASEIKETLEIRRRSLLDVWSKFQRLQWEARNLRASTCARLAPSGRDVCESNTDCEWFDDMGGLCGLRQGH